MPHAQHRSANEPRSPRATAAGVLIACPDCGTIQHMPPPPERGHVACCRCGNVLEDTNGRSLDAALACALATLLLLFPGNLLTLLSVHVAGISESTRLASGLFTSWKQGWPVVTIILALQGIILPFIRFGLLAVTLGAIRCGLRAPWLGRAFRYCEALDRWAMADVLAIGFGVGYGRVASQIPVRIDAGGWCFLAAAIMTLFTRATLERRAVWRALAMPPRKTGRDPLACTACDLVLPAAEEGQRCPRCAARVHRRRPFAFNHCLALTLASWMLIPLSYFLPMSELWEAGSPHPHSILDGIRLLFNHGYWPFGVLITLASVGIPLGKLIGLTWFLISTHQHSAARLRLKTRLYRFVDQSGRWSNLDPFTVMIFAPMVQFGQLAHIDIMGGSLAFLSMVVLSMLAAMAFDPRLMWDAAGEPAQPHRAAQPGRA